MYNFVAGSPLVAFAVVFVCLFIGDIVSTKTKAFVPSMLVFVILMTTATWTGLIPTDTMNIAGFTMTLCALIVSFYLVDMGTMISLQELKLQWKTVLIALGAVAGVAALVLPVGSMLFGWQKTAAAAPVIAGGNVACMEMSSKATELGNTAAATLASMVLLLQNFPGYILMPVAMKIEGKKLLSSWDGGKVADQLPVQNDPQKQLFIDKVPKKYKTTAFYLFPLTAAAVVAQQLSKLVNGVVPATIFGLILGMILSQLGIIGRNNVQKSNCAGFLLVASTIPLFGNIMAASPKEILALLGMVVVLLVIGIAGIVLGSVIVGKIVKASVPMSIAIGLNCLLGFPHNFFLMTESVRALAKNDEEAKYLNDTMWPSILVGGFVTVTIGSVIFAGIMKNFL